MRCEVGLRWTPELEGEGQRGTERLMEKKKIAPGKISPLWFVCLFCHSFGTHTIFYKAIYVTVVRALIKET